MGRDSDLSFPSLQFLEGFWKLTLGSSAQQMSSEVVREEIDGQSDKMTTSAQFLLETLKEIN